MNFTNKIGVYTVEGEALERYKKMQCRSRYKKYLRNTAFLAKKLNCDNPKSISFDEFCAIMIVVEKPAKQQSLF